MRTIYEGIGRYLIESRVTVTYDRARPYRGTSATDRGLRASHVGARGRALSGTRRRREKFSPGRPRAAAAAAPAQIERNITWSPAAASRGPCSTSRSTNIGRPRRPHLFIAPAERAAAAALTWSSPLYYFTPAARWLGPAARRRRDQPRAVSHSPLSKLVMFHFDYDGFAH
ncbi:hypothetical protein EVAR_90346_1 [Eumeta japonica]|uniref:Uncharacterized protein n=1 Tax=Eumeta variegata TaxID=151549 RepID=A0A4C1YL77_EUMVA|nr:hypothetical protein EVAR_90346_1 [Eumeta japonica]